MIGEVKFEFYSADAQTAAVIKIYSYEGVELTLGARERFVMKNAFLVSAGAVVVDVFSDNNADGVVDAGERMFGGDFAANGGGSLNFLIAMPAKRGIVPKVKASGAGNIKLTGTGEIRAC